jgi:hypothetical protein
MLIAAESETVMQLTTEKGHMGVTEDFVGILMYEVLDY